MRFFFAAPPLHHVFRRGATSRSDIPSDVKSYSHMQLGQRWPSRCSIILRSPKAHFVGLSMGGFTAVMLGIHQPSRFLSLTIAGAGLGFGAGAVWKSFARPLPATADEIREARLRARGEELRHGPPPAIPFLVKDPRGFAVFNERFASHDAKGRGEHAGADSRRDGPSLYDCEADIRKIQGCRL